jgi:hypothetical protein
MDSLRTARRDSLRAAGVADSVIDRGRRGGGRGGFGGPEGRGRAGGPGGRGMGPGMMAGLAGIQLSDAEKNSIKALNEKHRQEMKEFRQAHQNDQPSPELRQQMQQIMERQRTELRGALTAEHQAQFDANIAKLPKPDSLGGGRRGRRPPQQ